MDDYSGEQDTEYDMCCIAILVLYSVLRTVLYSVRSTENPILRTALLRALSDLLEIFRKTGPSRHLGHFPLASIDLDSWVAAREHASAVSALGFPVSEVESALYPRSYFVRTVPW